jgi:hypothetical protein
MRTSNTNRPPVSKSPEIDHEPTGEERPIIRVLWHGAYGSTYQRYNRPGRGQSRPSLAGYSNPSQGHSSLKPDPDDEHSLFSRPLTCPNCQGAFDLHQLKAASPDRLLGTCSHCQTRVPFEVGFEGRLTLSLPTVQSYPARSA